MMIGQYSSLTVVTVARWLVEDLADAGTIPVTGSLGLDEPALDGSTALWCSGAFATRLRAGDVEHPFLSPGPAWLSQVPHKFLRRKVETLPLSRILNLEDGLRFYKLSEHKHSGIPAGVHHSPTEFLSLTAAAFGGLERYEPALDSLSLTVSEPMDYRREYRCFIAHGKVTASSFYLARVPGINDSTVELTWDGYTEHNCPDSTAAAAFAQQVVDAMGANQPPGYVLDVGTDKNGHWSVVEANAAWSSNIYHAERAGVIEAVLASQEPAHGQWTWQPDKLFLNRTRPLVATPAERSKP